MTFPHTLALNCSILWREKPIPERLRLAAAAGFQSVEFWWPFETAKPSPEQVDAFAGNILDSGLQLVGLNLFAGDMASGDRGVLSWPGREDELFSSAQIALDLGTRLGTHRFNVLYGNRISGHDPEAQDSLAVENVRNVAALFESSGSVVMIEPVSGATAYPLKTAADVDAFIRRATSNGGPENIGLLLDLYHLAVNGDDVAAAIKKYGMTAEHVQVADAPGRGAPGSGELPLDEWVAQLRATGYAGVIALEFAGSSDQPFAEFELQKWEVMA